MPVFHAGSWVGYGGCGKQDLAIPVPRTLSSPPPPFLSPSPEVKPKLGGLRIKSPQSGCSAPMLRVQAEFPRTSQAATRPGPGPFKCV